MPAIGKVNVWCLLCCRFQEKHRGIFKIDDGLLILVYIFSTWAQNTNINSYALIIELGNCITTIKRGRHCFSFTVSFPQGSWGKPFRQTDLVPDDLPDPCSLRQTEQRQTSWRINKVRVSGDQTESETRGLMLLCIRWMCNNWRVCHEKLQEDNMLTSTSDQKNNECSYNVSI